MWSIRVSEVIEKARNRGAHTVALQFPDGLKPKAGEVGEEFRRAGFEVFISGDPCWGACDLPLELLDFVDLIIHFGHAPVDEHERILYEYVPMDFDPAILSHALPLLSGEKIGIVTTVQHSHMMEGIISYLRSQGVDCIVGKGGPRTPLPGQILGCSYGAARATGAREILYVGTGQFHPLGVALATSTRVIALDPYTGVAEVVDAERLLRKRFVKIEKAKTAQSTGILVSLKSGQKRMALAKELVKMKENAFIVTLREITPEALLNLGFECYVNTACPRLAYDDQIRFPAPVLSPPEFEIACGLRSWDHYIIDEMA